MLIKPKAFIHPGRILNSFTNSPFEDMNLTFNDGKSLLYFSSIKIYDGENEG